MLSQCALMCELHYPGHGLGCTGDLAAFLQVVNRAARVMALSAPGEIVLSKPAREAVSGAEEVKYTFEDIGFFALKAHSN